MRAISSVPTRGAAAVHRGIHASIPTSRGYPIQLGSWTKKAGSWLVGFITLIWFSSMIRSGGDGLNLIYRTKTIRNYVVSKLLSFAMIPRPGPSRLSVGITTVATVVANQPVLATSSSHTFPFSRASCSDYVCRTSSR